MRWQIENAHPHGTRLAPPTGCADQVGGLTALSELANATGDPHAAAKLHSQAARITAAINTKLFNGSSGLYVDGADGTGAPVAHSAWHASVFPAAFGLVPRERWPKLLQFFRAKGMTGSVYAAYW